MRSVSERVGRGGSSGGVCFLFSIDEFLELHERLDVIGNQLGEAFGLDLHFTWVIPGVIIALGIALVLLRLVIAMRPIVRWRLVAAGVVFVTGGFVVETLSGLSIAEHGATWRFFLLTLVEESLEMIGVAMLIATLISSIDRRWVEGGVAYRERALAHPATQ